MLPRGQREAAPRETSGGPCEPSHLLVPPSRASCPLCLQLLDQKEDLTLEVQQLTQDCTMQQQRNAGIQAQMRELLSERDQVVQTVPSERRSGSF